MLVAASRVRVCPALRVVFCVETMLLPFMLRVFPAVRVVLLPESTLPRAVLWSRVSRVLSVAFGILVKHDAATVTGLIAKGLENAAKKSAKAAK